MADSKPPDASKPVHPGERLASYFDNFFKTVLGVATLGASITFAKIVQTPVKPFHDYGFSAHAIQFLLAISWLLFVLALAFTSFFASLLSLYRPQAVKYFGTKSSSQRRTVMWYVTGVSFLLFGLLIGAFVFVSLVVVGYAGPVGWITVAACVVFGVVGFGAIISQSPVFMRDGDGGEGLSMLSPVVERGRGGKGDDYGEKDGVRVQGRYDDGDRRYGRKETMPVGSDGRHGRIETAPEYSEDWRYSRDARLRVLEFNNRYMKDIAPRVQY